MADLVQTVAVVVIAITAFTQAFIDMYYRNLGVDTAVVGLDSAVLTARVGFACAATAGFVAAGFLAYVIATAAFDVARHRFAAGLFYLALVVVVVAAGLANRWGYPLAAAMMFCAGPGLVAAFVTSRPAIGNVPWKLWRRTIAACVAISTALGLVPALTDAAATAATTVRADRTLPDSGFAGLLLAFGGIELRELHHSTGDCEVVVALTDDTAWVLGDVDGGRGTVRSQDLAGGSSISRAGLRACDILDLP